MYKNEFTIFILQCLNMKISLLDNLQLKMNKI